MPLFKLDAFKFSVRVQSILLMVQIKPGRVSWWCMFRKAIVLNSECFDDDLISCHSKNQDLITYLN